jgi:hypothetical protein
MIYLTFDSITKRHKALFGYQSDYIAEKLYLFLSNGVKLKRINMYTYIKKFSILYNETWKDKMRFSF